MAQGKDRSFRSCKVTVHGDVESRDFLHVVSRQAENQGLAGIAKHEPPKTAVIRLEGPGYRTDYFMEWLRRGDHGFAIRRIYKVAAPKENLLDFLVE